MLNMNSKKTRKIVSAVIVIILCIAMVLRSEKEKWKRQPSGCQFLY